MGFSVHTTFWGLLTHYQLDLVTVSIEGPVEDYPKAELEGIHEGVCTHVETLAAKYEEEALPRASGGQYLIFVFISILRMMGYHARISL